MILSALARSAPGGSGAGPQTRFLPFDQGHDGHASNPPNPDGHRSAYLWQRVWQRDAWIDHAAGTLSSIDEYYADQHGAGDGVASQLVRQLAEPAPQDRSTTRNLRQYKNLAARWQEWDEVVSVCRKVGDRDGGRPAMSLVFRNIDVSPEDPVEVWPTEAVLTALQRGGSGALAAAHRSDRRGPMGAGRPTSGGGAGGVTALRCRCRDG
ncbi:MAG: hypothetical protein ACRDTD_27470 [Pseudonocardiaceae bacterium]